MTTQTPLGWGLIGASAIAEDYMIDAINAQPDSRVVGVRSSSMRRAREFAAANDIPHFYDSLDDLLENDEVDVVYVSTTNERHLAATVQAAQYDKHVLCEKPLALTLGDALEMVAECRRADVVMGTNQHLRAAPHFVKMRNLIADGAIGKPLAARVFHAVYLPPQLQTWRIKSPGAGGGVILDITVHDADTLRFVLNDEVDVVSAISERQGLGEKVEDAVMGTMRFRSGLLAQFHDAFTIKHAGTGFQVHGTEGSLFADEAMTHHPAKSLTLRRNGNVEEIEFDHGANVYSDVIRSFNDAVHSNIEHDGHGEVEPVATAEDGVRSLAVALAAIESTQRGQHVRVQYDQARHEDW